MVNPRGTSKGIVLGNYWQQPNMTSQYPGVIQDTHKQMMIYYTTQVSNYPDESPLVRPLHISQPSVPVCTTASHAWLPGHLLHLPTFTLNLQCLSFSCSFLLMKCGV